jgi:S-DNA-T family DNA segregation ATPase FtsK/SpoIIIE
MEYDFSQILQYCSIIFKIIQQSGFYVLTLLNLYFFGQYHGVFVFDVAPIATPFASFVLSQSLLANFIIYVNWFFGFAFLPIIPYLVFYCFKQEYSKSYYALFSMICVDLVLSSFYKSGAIGTMCSIFIDPFYLVISGILISMFLHYLLFVRQTTKPILRAKVRPIIQIIQNKEELPSLDLLSVGKKISINIDIEAQKKILLQTLKDFGITAKIIDIKIGPVVTLYAIEIAAGIKSIRVINLADDIARTMQTFSARIATIPGKNLMGIEISNEKRQTVYFKEALEEVQTTNYSLPLYLGCDIYGEFKVFDLSAMPHLLVAGTTGSGKSVGIHSMLLSLLFTKRPNELKLILIDPKKLELSPYEKIPHLLLPIIIDAKEAINALKWAVREMENRYINMSKIGARNITTFNAKIENEKSEIKEKIPFIVVVIDEMADLMLIAGKEIEICIQRLAQMGRAAGIHMITATQRPSVDVITGTIKANFPSRISFKLSTKIDSRTILGDMSGAEQLLGAGDMLYLGINGQLTRLHGGFVSEDDVLAVVEFWKKQGEPQYIELITEEMHLANNDFNEPYYQEAVALVRNTKKVSTSFLQRNFQIGYNRAAKIIEQMEKEGIISSGDKFGRGREINN